MPAAMEFLRTPDERFDGLPGWGFAPRWLTALPGAAGLRMHYIDEGRDTGGGTALCLHGNPSWGYLYRSMVPVFVAAGMRVVAPDLIGFGRSDKPVDEAAHRFVWHRDLLRAFVEELDLRDITLVCQDWAGLLGLTLPMAMPQRFSRLLVMNTTLATGEALTEGFRQWRDYSSRTPDLEVGRMIARGKPEMTPGEIAAYDAPFPDARHKAALRAFPNLVPDSPQAEGAALSREALAWWRDRFEGSAFMAIGQRDPVLGEPTMRALHANLRGCAPPLVVPQAGHFVPEWGEPIARAALASFGLTGGAGRQ